MDRVTAGVITSYSTLSLRKETPNRLTNHVESGNDEFEASDYVGTLLRDPTSSHLLETIVSRSPPRAFDILWELYFKAKLARLAAHPVANFVVAKALERLSPEQMTEAYEELSTLWHKMIRMSSFSEYFFVQCAEVEHFVETARTGVIRAFVERAASLGIMKAEVPQVCLPPLQSALTFADPPVRSYTQRSGSQQRAITAPSSCACYLSSQKRFAPIQPLHLQCNLTRCV